MPSRRQARFTPYLAAIRAKKYWTQGRLAQESGVSLATIQYLESDKQPHPAGFGTITKLAEALGVDPDVLVNGPPPDSPPNKAD
jgi:transcriptional regulator with XRE-family HTH domain